MIEGADSYDILAGMARAIFGEHRRQFTKPELFTAKRALDYRAPKSLRVGVGEEGIE